MKLQQKQEENYLNATGDLKRICLNIAKLFSNDNSKVVIIARIFFNFALLKFDSVNSKKDRIDLSEEVDVMMDKAANLIKEIINA